MEFSGHRMKNIESDCREEKGYDGDVTVAVSSTSSNMAEFVFLALQPIVSVFSQPGSGL
jgi:hypothetical protein